MSAFQEIQESDCMQPGGRIAVKVQGFQEIALKNLAYDWFKKPLSLCFPLFYFFLRGFTYCLEKIKCDATVLRESGNPNTVSGIGCRNHFLFREKQNDGGRSSCKHKHARDPTDPFFPIIWHRCSPPYVSRLFTDILQIIPDNVKNADAVITTSAFLTD